MCFGCVFIIKENALNILYVNIVTRGKIHQCQKSSILFFNLNFSIKKSAKSPGQQR